MSGARRRPPYRLVRQMELADCGAACLATVLRGHGLPVHLGSLRDLAGTGRDGVSFAGLLQAARAHGFDGRGVRCPVDRLGELPAGAVLHWGDNHFVVLTGLSRRGLHLLDPAVGHRVVPMPTVQREYSGVALVLTAPPDLEPAAPPRDERVRWRRYASFVQGARRPLLGALLLAAVVQACALVYPLVLKRVVEQAGGAVDGAATALALGVAVLGVGFLLAQVGRLLCLVALQRLVDVQLTLGVLRHLAALPYAFIARRSTGDLALRIRSTFAVRQILTASALSAVLDGTLVLGYLLVILVVDVAFWALTVLALGIQVFLVAVTWRRMRQTAAEALEAQTTAQSGLLELVNGFELLKASGGAARAVDEWSARLRREVQAQATATRVSGLVDSVLASVRFVTPPALLVLGLARVADGSLELSDMLALAALAAAVTVPVGALLSTVCSLTSVFSYLDRLDDLLQEEPERHGRHVAPARLSGAVRLEQVTFRYSPLLPAAVEDVSLTIEPGEHVAVAGASGSGKTTLVLLLASLYDPSEGRVLLDGVPAAGYDRDQLRQRIGIVTQAPTLFNATLRENIAMGRTWLTDDDVVAAATAAALHEDVQRLPSGYATRLGNAGTGLSGGQRQRVALARALAGRPGLLVLDEATSALDAVTEQVVHEALAELDCTRVVVAHRLSTVAKADRVLVMSEGRLVADGSYASLRRRSPEFRALLQADGRLRST